MNILNYGPFFDTSGYAVANRAIMLELHKLGAAISVLPIASNNEPVPFDHEDTPLLSTMLQRTQPLDGFMISHCPAPMFIRKTGFKNIGLTMTECDRIDAQWVHKCNEMDEVWVPSHFNRVSFIQCGVAEEKIFVMPYGVNTEKFRPGIRPYPRIGKKRFTFLSNFEYIPRKGCDLLVLAYCQEFSGDEDVCLLIKGYENGGRYEPSGKKLREEVRCVQEKAGYPRPPAIEIITTILPSRQLPALYASADCYVSASRGEGWNLPAIEAMAMGLPVICTNWSAHLEFMNHSNSYLIDVEAMDPVPGSSGALWARPNLEHTRALMRYVFSHRKKARRLGRKGRSDIVRHFTWRHSAQRMYRRLLAIENQQRMSERRGNTKLVIPVYRPTITERERQAVLSVLDSGFLTSGEVVKEFEKRFAAYIGRRHAIATSSGTTGLHVALLAAGIGQGDRVLTTPFTFVATSNAILYCQAQPVYADVDGRCGNLNPELVAEVLSRNPGTRALLAVHLFGLPCDMDRLQELIREFNLILVEDCAQAHGAEFHGRKVGTFGQLAVFSFYGTKNMTTGEGGMVLTDDDELAETCRLLVNHGSSSKYQHEILGYNYRMTDLAAALGMAQLEKLEQFIREREANARFLTAQLRSLPWLVVPETPSFCRHAFHQYTIQVQNRTAFLAHLEAHGVGFGVHYPLPVHRQPLYRKLGFGSISLPISEELATKVVSLPVYPGLSPAQLEVVANVVKQFKNRGVG